MKELGFLDYFSGLEDNRCSSYILYPVNELLLITLCAVICGAEGWQDIEDFGYAKLEFLRKFLAYEHGVPSDDTLRRFFRTIDSKAFQEMFINWVGSLNIGIEEGVIAIDGKTSRRSFDDDKKPLHMVSAFASEARIVLGQQKTYEKSNEITTIPLLLELLDIKDSIVSIDAMGCQKEIANKIKDKEGDYILGLKGNQGSLYDDVKLFFDDIKLQEQGNEYEETDKGHGRIEVRKCTVTDNIDWLKKNHDWKGLRSIVMITSHIEQRNKVTEETRYYITSLPPNPQKLLQSIRSHWSIENSLHWTLDMSFNDDQSRIRKQNAPQNMAILKHIALNMIRTIQKKRQSIKGLRKQAGWNNAILRAILCQQNNL